MDKPDDDILQQHLRAIEGACAYRSDGGFATRLQARMAAQAPSRRAPALPGQGWLLGALALLLALNLWTALSSAGASDDRAASLGAFAAFYDTTPVTSIE
jgi:hypothetical protein